MRNPARNTQTSLWRALLRRLTGVWIPPRIQGFEFCDQPWLGGVWREAYLDGLRFLFNLGGVYRSMHIPFARWAAAAGHARVLDLASGNGGPTETMLANAQANGIVMPTIVLSDFYPDRETFERLKQAHSDQIDYIAEKVDAVSNPLHTELVSICSAFHHFPPDLARKLLANAGEGSDGIFIMEVFSRYLLTPFQSLMNLIPLMISCFSANRVSLRKARHYRARPHRSPDDHL